MERREAAVMERDQRACFGTLVMLCVLIRGCSWVCSLLFTKLYTLILIHFIKLY